MHAVMQEYVDILIQEVNAIASFNEQPLQSLFFGGGTPSLIPPRQLDQILRAIDRRFGIAAGGLSLHSHACCGVAFVKCQPGDVQKSALQLHSCQAAISCLPV